MFFYENKCHSSNMESGLRAVSKIETQKILAGYAIGVFSVSRLIRANREKILCQKMAYFQNGCDLELEKKFTGVYARERVD